MSTTSSPSAEHTLARCRPTDTTPVSIPADALDSTAPKHLRKLTDELADEGYVPDEIVVTTTFDEDCSLATQDEADRIRDYIRAADYLGATTVTVDFDDVAAPEKVRPALDACAERARRDGVTLELDGPLSLS